MGLEACLMAAKFIHDQTPSKTLINPFCGEGSMLAAANFLGLEAIGIERSPKRAEKARVLQILKENSSWKFSYDN
jgi:tRNA G10  N-methylase Trm11